MFSIACDFYGWGRYLRTLWSRWSMCLFYVTNKMPSRLPTTRLSTLAPITLKSSKKTNHIEVSHHFRRDHVDKGDINLNHFEIKNMLVSRHLHEAHGREALLWLVQWTKYHGSSKPTMKPCIYVDASNAYWSLRCNTPRLNNAQSRTKVVASVSIETFVYDDYVLIIIYG
jgi:hypothetical protein